MANKKHFNHKVAIPPLRIRGGMFYGAQPMIFELAKKLRNKVTPAEMILWGKLKENFPTLKFRRQHPISLYIADFYCHKEKLIIEIDGSIHQLPEVKAIDYIRQKDLESLGIKVLRFSTYEIMHQMDKVILTINKSAEF
jgi:cyclase